MYIRKYYRQSNDFIIMDTLLLSWPTLYLPLLLDCLMWNDFILNKQNLVDYMKIPFFSETNGRHIAQGWSMEDGPMEYKSSTK